MSTAAVMNDALATSPSEAAAAKSALLTQQQAASTLIAGSEVPPQSTSVPPLDSVMAAEEESLSPTAALHRALLAHKRESEAETAATLRHLSSVASKTATDHAAATAPIPVPFRLGATEFPPLLPSTAAATSPMHQCIVHAASPSQHAHGHACTTRAVPHCAASSNPACCSMGSSARASFWNARCSCIFSALPDELLLCQVFALLGAGELARVSAVCGRWRFLAADRMLWQSVDLSPFARSVDGSVLDSLLERTGRHVRQLKLCNLRLIDGDALRRLGNTHLAANQGALRALHFCSLKAVDLSVMESLLQGGAGSNLREFSLFGCVGVDDACVSLIRRQCVRLEDLSLRGCIKITDAAFVVEEASADAAALAAELEGLWSPRGALATQAEAVDPLSLSLAQLAQLELVEGRSRTNNNVRARARSSSSRSRTLLSASSSFSSSAGDDLLSPCSGVSSEDEGGSFAHLSALNLANCKSLSAAGLVAAFRASPRLARLNLHALDASDALLEQLVRACPLLEQLHLSSANPFLGNARLTDAGVALLAARLPRLAQLNLQGSSQLTDACLPKLVRACPGLTKLNLGGCSRLTDRAVRILCGADEAAEQTQASAAAAASSSPSVAPVHVEALRLSHLSLFQCALLTDASVALLAERMPALQHLDLHSCNQLSDQALQTLAKRQGEEQQQQQQFELKMETFKPAPSSTMEAASVLPPLAPLASSSPPRLPSFSPPRHRVSTSLDDSELLLVPSSNASPSTPAGWVLPLLQSLDVGSCRRISAGQVEALKATRSELLVTHY